MKKLFVLMMLILIAFFIFSPSAIARTSVNVHEDQRPPHAVTYCENLIFDWYFDIPEGAKEYTVEILNKLSRNGVWSKTNRIETEEKEKEYVKIDNFGWHIPKDLPDGRYVARIETIGGAAEEDFVVSIDRGDLTICKFYDTNQNGMKDEDEQGLLGWSFEIQKSGEREILRCTTGSDGKCAFYKLSVGNYTITEKKEEKGRCWRNTTPITNTTVVKKDQTTTVNFGNYGFGTLEIIKFNDINGNSIRDDPTEEEGLANWEFTITQDGRTIDTRKTNETGFCVLELPEGKYSITEELKKGWINTAPITQEKEVKICSITKVEFGNRVSPPGNVSILKFNDTNHNGIQDDGESPISNWGFRIRIKDSSGSVIIRHTDEHGKIIQELASNAEYEITENFRVGWKNTTPRMQSVYIEPEKVTPVGFGNYKPSKIIIYKFDDTNGNGVRDRGEEWIDNWNFTIKDPNGVDHLIKTDRDGKAKFDDAILGEYVITEEERGNWTNTTPRIQKVEVIEEGQTVEKKFGNRRIPPPVVKPCIEYGIYMNSVAAPRIHNNSDENLRVEKYLDPRIVHCDNPDPDIGEIINVTLRVCVLAGMEPTDLVFAVDTSGSLFEREGAVLKVIKDGIIDFIQKNEARFGENVRIGLVSWDEKIDETVNLTTDYSEVKKACGILETLPEEDTVYQVGLNGSIEVFNRSPRENVKKVIVFITDAKGTFDGFCNYSKLPDTSAYVIHAITIGPTQNEGIVNMLKNFTSQYNGTAVRVNESYEELEKELTNLTVSCIERRTLKNVTVVETLPNYMRALKDGYEIPPTTEHINSDGMEWSTVTMKWDIGDLSSDKCWENTFKVLFCCRVPVDVTQPEGISRITSEVTYSDPTNNTITKHLLIPEGGLWIEPPQVPKGLLEKIREVPGFEALFAIAGLLAVAYLVWRRRKA